MTLQEGVELSKAFNSRKRRKDRFSLEEQDQKGPNEFICSPLPRGTYLTYKATSWPSSRMFPLVIILPRYQLR